MDILILGGNGFIGLAVALRLEAEGHRITALGRSVGRVNRQHPNIRWKSADLAQFENASGWHDLVQGHQIIVNCAGALQDGLRDDLAATQERAMLALYQAANEAGGRRIVQISARVEGAAGSLPFLATKARADRALAASGLDHVILRPALVVGRNAHGGTALVRALAALPLVLPLVHAASPVETVALDDVAEAVALAVAGKIESGSDIDLAASGQLSLGEVVAAHRAWLGLPATPVINLPAWIARPISLLADLAGKLGWRSPLRSTAMTVMTEGVLSGPGTGAPFPLASLAETLRRNPAGVQDLWFARLYLLKAPAILALSFFWLLSGTIPLFRLDAAAAHFLPLLPQGMAIAATLATCLLDIVLGLAVLVRPFARSALLGMLAVTMAYLAAATLVEPSLWLDPLGPLVKVVPSIFLTLAALAILDER